MKRGFEVNDLALRIATAAACVALCVVLSIALEWMNIDAPYLLFLSAIAGICALGGLSVAVWMVLFSTLGLWAVFIPPAGFAFPNVDDSVHIGVFIGACTFVCWIIDGLRRANAELSRDNVALGCKISVLLNRHKAR